SCRTLLLVGSGRLERTGLPRILRQLLFPRIAHQTPAALGAGNRAAPPHETARHACFDAREALRRHPLVAHVAGHLLALEHLAGVLALAGRAVASVADGDTVRGSQAGEVPALHRALEALALVGAGHVDELTRHEVVGGDLRAHLDQV